MHSLQGVKTVFKHYRYDTEDGSLKRYYRRGEHFVPRTRGGMTECILDIGGANYTGVAVCSRQDNFDYAKGRRIAAGRAWKQYQKAAQTISGVSSSTSCQQ